jgi:hypothetical protein
MGSPEMPPHSTCAACQCAGPAPQTPRNLEVGMLGAEVAAEQPLNTGPFQRVNPPAPGEGQGRGRVS